MIKKNIIHYRKGSIQDWPYRYFWAGIGHVTSTKSLRVAFSFPESREVASNRTCSARHVIGQRRDMLERDSFPCGLAPLLSHH